MIALGPGVAVARLRRQGVRARPVAPARPQRLRQGEAGGGEVGRGDGGRRADGERALEDRASRGGLP
ncbi:MAG TPA: hypothetical protein VGQ83_19605, partial [Polyangia bacterium]